MLQKNDDAILAAAIQGNREAFGELYQRHVVQIYNYIYYRTGNVHDAEDLTERVFMRALRHIENYSDRGLPFSAWLYRIAHNLVANWHRDNSRKQESTLDDLPLESRAIGEHPEAALMAQEKQDALLEIIRKLPQERQQLIVLKFAQHLSNAEIGKIMGRTEGAIKSLYHRTLLSLREDIELNLTEEVFYGE